MSDLDIIRRIAERGLQKAQAEQSQYVDLFQHLLDELRRVPAAQSSQQTKQVCKTCNGEGGWETCGSSTNYFWKDCPDCKPSPPSDDAKDAARYRWLVANSFDHQGTTQLHVWEHSWEPHSKTGEPTEWKSRVRGPALDACIDTAMQKGVA